MAMSSCVTYSLCGSCVARTVTRIKMHATVHAIDPKALDLPPEKRCTMHPITKTASVASKESTVSLSMLLLLSRRPSADRRMFWCPLRTSHSEMSLYPYSCSWRPVATSVHLLFPPSTTDAVCVGNTCCHGETTTQSECVLRTQCSMFSVSNRSVNHL